MSDKRIDMSVFVGRDFDCEFYAGLDCGPTGDQSRPVWSLNELSRMDTVLRCYDDNIGVNTVICRPRLNKAQVLDDYAWLPDGLICKLKAYNPGHEMLEKMRLNSSDVKSQVVDEGWEIYHIEIVALHPDYAEQAKEWDYPVVEL